MSNGATLLKKSARYALMPGIIPRIKDLGLNFGYLASLIAYLFSIINLIPKGHPYLSENNTNRFGVINVFLEAYSNMKWSIRHVDQIAVFGLVVLAFALLLGQLFTLLLFLVSYSGPAVASGVTGFFTTTPPTDDMAFMMLDRVFGIPGFFGSCISQNVACLGDTSPMNPLPWAFHDGLHALFRFYSLAMLFVGMIIVFYYVIVLVLETMQTGTPFGQRFASVYAPLRLVLAVMLLLPLAHGINTGQYFMLHVAKIGSSLGTNTWKIFNSSLSNALGTGSENMVIKVNAPDTVDLVRFYHTVVSCKAIYKRVYGYDIAPYMVNGSSIAPVTSFAALKSHFGGAKDMIIQYGRVNADYTKEVGNFKPFCGGIRLAQDSDDNPFATDISNVYFALISALWGSADLNSVATKTADKRITTSGPSTAPCPTVWGGGCTGAPPIDYLRTIATQAQADLSANLDLFLSDGNLAGYIGLDYDSMQLDLGWGGAGIWFNQIAQVNGSIVTAVFAMPEVQSMPSVMEFVAKEREQKVPGSQYVNPYGPQLPNGEDFNWKATGEDQADRIAGYLNEIYKYGQNDTIDPTPPMENDSNVIGTVLSAMFGANGLFDIRENNEVHPLAQMAGLGKSITEAAIRNIGIGLIGSAASGVMATQGNPYVAAVDGISGTFITIGTIALTTGFLLYYILPFLPFIYFFFAVGKWVKGIFEAMVAIPLWALSHLKIDGDGIAGSAARNGYLLIFEIMIRPVATVFGLIAALSIFTAMAVMMNELFDLAAANLSGYDSYTSPGTYMSGTGTPTFFDAEYYRSGVDQFFFTLLYVVLIYILATSCFKLIDMVPNSILRWMGESVETFGDQAEDAADNLIRYAAIGGGMLGGQLTDALKDTAKSTGMLFGGLASPPK